MKPPASLTAMAAAVFIVGCLSRPASTTTSAPTPARDTSTAMTTTSTGATGFVGAEPRFAWRGVYDVVGDGFPEGMRSAIIIITPRDTSFDFSIEGPPGTLMSATFVGDSLHVVWDMYGEPMHVDLQGVADSLDGRWRIGDRGGRVWGNRRR